MFTSIITMLIVLESMYAPRLANRGAYTDSKSAHLHEITSIQELHDKTALVIITAINSYLARKNTSPSILGC